MTYFDEFLQELEDIFLTSVYGPNWRETYPGTPLPKEPKPGVSHREIFSPSIDISIPSVDIKPTRDEESEPISGMETLERLRGLKEALASVEASTKESTERVSSEHGMVRKDSILSGISFGELAKMSATETDDDLEEDEDDPLSKKLLEEIKDLE